MEYWDFLLQKEGDRSWLPLEAPDVEILEGRYRVVARSSRVEVPVEIRVTHACMSSPPIRRVQARSGQTNREGLLVVMPYTQLQPGIWELRCRGDLMSDLLGEGWQSIVQLQVVAEEASQFDWQDAGDSPAELSPSFAHQFEPAPVIAACLELPQDSPAAEAAPMVSDRALPTEPKSPVSPAAALEPSTSETPASVPFEIMAPAIEIDIPTANDLPAAASAQSEQLVEAIFTDFDQELDQVIDRWEPIDSPVANSSSTAAASPSHRLTLEQESYVVQRGQTLLFKGQVETVGAAAPSDFEGEVTLQLRDPQRSVVVAEVRQPLPHRSLPLSFDCAVTIPADYQAHLLLGEVVLVGSSGTIATHAFTVTIDLDELLSAVALSSDLVQPPLAFMSEPANDLNLAFLDLLAAPAPPLRFQPSLPSALPPQIYQPDPDRPKVKSIQLPFAARLARQGGAAAPEEVKESLPEAADTSARVAEAAPEIELAIRTSADEAVLPIAEPTAPMASPSLPQPSSEIDSPDLPLEWQTASELMRLDQPGRLARPATKEDTAFRSLNLKQRFWSRLNSLAGDEELSTWLETSTPNSPQGTRPVSSFDADLAAQEFVVEAEMPVAPHRAAQIEEPPASLVISKDQPIPTPRLDLPLGELIAGKLINVKVKLPNVAPRIYVKLWLRDRQNWVLLDGPRWLVTFIPDGLGTLEAHLPITVPFGCLEVQFEAIAVEMATQRESHKVTIDRLVVPPDLPALSLEELDV